MDPDLTPLIGLAAGAPILSVGADIVDVDRMRQIVARRPSFVSRVFTDAEQSYCREAADAAQRFAARFAAKEAGLKALGVGLGGADFHDFEVTKHHSGQPELIVTGRAKKLAESRGVSNWLITLSHSDLSALAVVLTTAELSVS